MTPSPADAPAGVEIKLLPRPAGAAWAAWLAANPAGAYWQNRRIIRPRLILIHTNGARGEGSRASAYNWSMAAQDNTKCHYQVDRDGSATKFLPSDRQGIANYKADPFSLSIETADLGWPTPGPACGFSAEQGETIAQIVAYETELWDIPIETPVAWDGAGVGAHTDPFAHPYWTKYAGKPCPGTTKKAEIRDWIMPRAREIRNGQPPPTPPSEDEVTIFGNSQVGKYGNVAHPTPGCSLFAMMPDGTYRSLGFGEWIALGQPFGNGQPDSVIDLIPKYVP